MNNQKIRKYEIELAKTELARLLLHHLIETEGGEFEKDTVDFDILRSISIKEIEELYYQLKNDQPDHSYPKLSDLLPLLLNE